MAKFCSKCGASLGEETKFCPSCGTQIGQKTTKVSADETAQASENTTSSCSSSNRSKMVAGLLGIFLGAWGIHNFYLGYNNKGVLQIVLTIVTCGIAGIWGFIEGILILCGNINVDADGKPLVD